MKSTEIRNTFIKYFADLDHASVKSSSLIPHDDPTLLFNNAGMNQFKNVFLGLEERPYNKAVSSQKCVRAGGKHNDLENVGFTARHHTFFEMLGNFSFGDYFKEKAIHYAWDLITNKYAIPKDRLYVTVFETDDEAYNIWLNQEKVPKDRIFRFGEKDNFWRMGNVGPCGPSSEIFFDMGPEVGGDPKENVMGGEGDRYMEISNLVFMQYNENESGTQSNLPSPSIDTGTGLERLCSVLQGKLNNYDTDLFLPIIERAAQQVKKEYRTADTSKEQNKINTALRVLADHSRSAAFLMGDGVLPSNEGRGYVLRRILRRAIRYGHNLSKEESLLPLTTEAVINNMSEFYPELKENKKLILSACQEEEERFKKTLEQGTEILNKSLETLKTSSKKTLPGEVSFRLYDTYGFPVDLTRVICQEQGFDVDEKGFHQHMEASKQQARASWKGQATDTIKTHLTTVSKDLLKTGGQTQFTGYTQTSVDSAKIIALSNGTELLKSTDNHEELYICLDTTPFYAESGGQSGDSGTLSTETGTVDILDCQKFNDIFWLKAKITRGQLSCDQIAKQNVNRNTRDLTASNHSATHLLHSALKIVLGDHVKQAGSLVDSEKLRFDFNHKAPLSEQEIIDIENLVNEKISQGIATKTEETSYDQAIEMGALALFGEKYGDKVRVLQFSDFSTELCGGTHVTNTKHIRAFKIVLETGVSSGVRRIEALTSDAALSFLLKNTREIHSLKNQLGLRQHWGQYLESPPTESPLHSWVTKKNQEIKDLQKKLKSKSTASVSVDDYIKTAEAFSESGAKLVWAVTQIDDRDALTQTSDQLKNKVGSGVVVTTGIGESDSHPIVVAVTKDLNKTVKAGDILKNISKTIDGKGGGRPDFAQGAFKNKEGLNAAQRETLSFLKSKSSNS